MGDDLNMPNFNLGDDADGWKSEAPEPPKEEKSEDKNAAKPKLLFEDNLEEKGEPMSTERTKPSKKNTEDNSEKKSGSKKIWLWIAIALLVIIIGGGYFLHSQGFLNLQVIISQVDKIKNSIFGGSSDTTKVQVSAVPDSTIVKKAENKDTTKSAETLKEEVKEATKAPEKPKIEEQKKPVSKSSLLKAPEKPKPQPVKIKEVKKTTEKPTAKKTVKKSIPAASGKFGIQVSAWKTGSAAKTEVNKLKQQGLNAYVVSVQLPDNKGKWHRVLVGSYNSSKDAENDLPNIKQKLNVDGIVREK